MNKSFFAATVLAVSLIASPTNANEGPEYIVKLFEVMGIDEQINGGFEAMLPAIDQLAAQFQLDATDKEELKEIYRDWFYNDIDRVKMREQMTVLYAQFYSEDEINNLTAFYETPTGQKLLSTSAELMKLSAQIGMQEAQLKQNQLLQRLQPFIEKHQAQ